MKIAFSFMLLLTPQVFAVRPNGYELGNGGSMISCLSSKILKKGVYSLDHIEGAHIHNLPPALSLKKMDNEREIVAYVLEKLSVVNPTRANLYKQWINEILSSREFITDFSFLPTPDSGVSFVPEGCKQEQAAIFITSPDKDKKTRFLFHKNLWEKASALDRAYLLLHEMIYREAVLPENLHTNSTASRYLNAWLMSHIDQLDSVELLNILRDLSFKRTDYRGFPLNLHIYYPPKGGSLPTPLQPKKAPIIYFKDSKQIRKAPLGDSFSIRIGNETFHRVCNDSFIGTFVTSPFVEFFPTGTVKRLHFYDAGFDEESEFSPGYKTTNCNFHGANYLEFDELGNLLKAESKELTEFAE